MKNTEMKFHVLSDIEAIANLYFQDTEDDWIVSNLGERAVKTSTWLPQATPFEKIWNFCLCSSMGEMIGYSEYYAFVWPRKAKDFEFKVAEYAQT